MQHHVNRCDKTIMDNVEYKFRDDEGSPLWAGQHDGEGCRAGMGKLLINRFYGALARLIKNRRKQIPEQRTAPGDYSVFNYPIKPKGFKIRRPVNTGSVLRIQKTISPLKQGQAGVLFARFIQYFS